MSTSRQMAKNVFYVYLRVGIVTILGLITARLSFQVLGQSDYGLFNVVGGIISVLAIISTAMSTTVRRYINVELGKEDGNPNKIFNTCLIINAGIAVLLFILAETIGLWYINNYLNVEADQFDSALIVFHICTLTSAISLINVPHQSLLAAHEHFKAVAVIDVGTQVVKLIGVGFLFLVPTNRVVWYAVILCMMTLLSLLAYSEYCKRHWAQIVRFKFWKDKKLYKEIVVFNNYIALGAACYLGRAQGSNMLINYFFGTMVNGAFSIAYMIENYAMVIISNLTTAAAPRLTKEYSSGNVSAALRTASKINRLSIIFMFMLVFLMILELPTVLKIWLGVVPEGSVVLCQWTLLSAASRCLSEGLPPLIQASGKIKWFQLFGSTLQISVLAFGWFLFKKGFPPQTIIIIFVCTTLFTFSANFFLMRAILTFDEIKFFIHTSLSKGIAFGCTLGIYYLITKVIVTGLNPYANFAFAAVYAMASAYLVGFSGNERRTIVSFVKSKLKKV